MPTIIHKIQPVLFLLLLITLVSNAQYPAQFGGSAPQSNASDEITAPQKEAIIKYLKKNVAELKVKGIISDNTQSGTAVKFIWPLKQAAGYTDPGFYGISNYVDEDKTYPDHLKDYNCGARTYDLASGYNHAGTDIFLWPFKWTKMDNNAVEIHAAAAGVIIGKSDGNYDKDCAFCTSTCDWNAVYVRNTDGTVCWYGHMKSGSLTAKLVGASVAEGEYLGVVGSSGNSTGPHLHFEVYSDDTYTTLIDPWEGTCNVAGNPSYWKSQQAYYVPSVNKIATHNLPPVFSSCYGGETPNFSDEFAGGDKVYTAVYLRDQEPGSSATYTILKPDATVYLTWTQDYTTYYNASYWYYYFTLPATPLTGLWTFRYSYKGKTYEHPFAVSGALPFSLIDFNGVKIKNTVQLNWKTVSEQNMQQFQVERSSDGITFSAIGIKPATGSGNAQPTSYSFVDAVPLNGKNYYRLKMVEKDGSYSLSKTINLEAVRNAARIILLTNPAKDKLQFIPAEDLGTASVRIADASGKIIINTNRNLLLNQQTQIIIQHLQAGAYYLIIDTKTQHISIPFLKQ